MCGGGCGPCGGGCGPCGGCCPSHWPCCGPHSPPCGAPSPIPCSPAPGVCCPPLPEGGIPDPRVWNCWNTPPTYPCKLPPASDFQLSQSPNRKLSILVTVRFSLR
ncbi:GH17231 [Drosophila grimshawi]|uniref:GH17231 n=1 Tax=Drosophila grimshawi TaxID=7222 RepID=B4JQK2_DROGR|nr:GH17231 [Drosophila grimshawi]